MATFPLIILLVSVILPVKSRQCRHVGSERVVQYGNWGNEETCPEGKFVVGFKLKVEPNQGSGDDTSLNGIEFLCEGGETKTSSVGQWGNWGGYRYCPTGKIAKGFRLRVESYQGETGDDTAANDLRLICEDGTTVNSDNGMEYGDWSSDRMCPNGMFITGIKTQIEAYHGAGIGYDDTALNNVDVKCCERPVTPSVMNVYWDMICHQGGDYSPRRCSLEIKGEAWRTDRTEWTYEDTASWAKTIDIKFRQGGANDPAGLEINKRQEEKTEARKAILTILETGSRGTTTCQSAFVDEHQNCPSLTIWQWHGSAEPYHIKTCITFVTCIPGNKPQCLPNCCKPGTDCQECHSNDCRIPTSQTNPIQPLA